MSSFKYLANVKDKTFICLHKHGVWNPFLKDLFDAQDDYEMLKLILTEDVFGIDSMPEWIEPLCQLINNFMVSSSLEDLVIFNDSADDLYICKCLKYKCVGSGVDYLDIAFHNRHLNEKDHIGRYDKEISKHNVFEVEDELEDYSIYFKYI